jgi:thymidine kinase
VIRIPPQRGGWLEVICGPMFSGKSEEMIRRLRRAEIAGQRVVIFKPRIDDRYDAADVVSHAGARMRAVAVDSVPELVARSAATTWSGSTRCSSSTARSSSAALSLAAVARASSCPGSTRTSARCRSARCRAARARRVRRQAAGRLPPLRRPATTTQRLVDGRPAPYSGETIVVGALDSYEARCRDCHEAGADALTLVA